MCSYFFTGIVTYWPNKLNVKYCSTIFELNIPFSYEDPRQKLNVKYFRILKILIFWGFEYICLMVIHIKFHFIFISVFLYSLVYQVKKTTEKIKKLLLESIT